MLLRALRDWAKNVDDTYYYRHGCWAASLPSTGEDFQSVIGREEQSQKILGGLPDALVACAGGGSNAIGLFHPFLKDTTVSMYGVEAGGYGIDRKTRCTTECGTPGVLHGNRTYVMTDSNGQISQHTCVSRFGLSGVGPEHSWLKDLKRVNYVSRDKEAMEAFHLLTKLEGIIPALESSHAVAYAMKLAKKIGDSRTILELPGRGDKDIETVARIEGIQI